ncbi:M23 family metallopeptidase [Streptomyces sp. NPDC052496]|uniref:M23 family metallopeptidase n=1 Tax=Streptomyces sp. NPDC052496 TaxID=3154951 RepID=UPI003428BAE6
MWEEWNPAEDSARPVRGKHRVAGKQRSGLARSGTVLGVGVIAAVGAGGVATADEMPQPAISVPDVGGLIPDAPDAASSVTSSGHSAFGGTAPGTSAPGTSAPGTSASLSRTGLAQDQAQAEAQAATVAQTEQVTDAGHSLSERIRRQTGQQQNAAEEEAHRADEPARSYATPLARSYLTPLTTYTLTTGFGQAGDRWAANHTGLDFASPAGTPVKAIHDGTITEAGWAGAYGYRVILTLDDGTELWFCHLSSLVRISGKVTAGDVIGRVGATGNVTAPHLHLEVRPGGTPVDPKPWLRDHGIDV